MGSKRLLYAFLTSLVVFLAACSAPPQQPTMTSSEAGASIDGLLQAGEAVVSAPAWSGLPVPAIEVVSTAGLPIAAATGQLPRGVYAYDDTSSGWTKLADSDDLDLSWDHDLETYGLLVDWNASAETLMIKDQLGNEFEVPAGAEATFSDSGAELASFALGSGWTTNQCGYDEPASASLSGYLGDGDAVLTLSRLDLALTDTAATDTVSAGFGASAKVGPDSLAVYLDLAGKGELDRADDCTISGFDFESGSVKAGVSTTVDGASRSLDVFGELSNLVYDGGVLGGFDLAGYLRLDGVLALEFAGTVNDANANGIPGDELMLTFAEGQTLSLEEFVTDQLGIGTLVAMRMMLR